MATVTNISAAADIPDVYTITIGGTWTTNETLTIKCGDRGVTIDTGASGSTVTSAIAAEVAAILVAESRRDGVGTGYSWSHGALEYGEFREIQNVSVSGSVVTVEGPAGIPIAITASETSTSGTVTVANPQAATGKYFWDNTANWDTGSLPVNGDTIIFGSESMGVRYGFPGTPIDPVRFRVTSGFTGTDRWIGLPEINRQDPNFPYYEYRERAPTFDDFSNETGVIEIGSGETGAGPSLVNVNWIDSSNLSVVVSRTGAPLQGVSNFAVNIWGAASTFDLYVTGGSVALCPSSTQSAVLSDCVVNTSGGNGAATVYIGQTVTGVSSTFTQHGGTLINDSGAAPTTVNQYGGLYIWGGLHSGSPTTINNYAGEMRFIGTVTATTLNCGGICDFDQSVTTFSTTNPLTLTAGAEFRDRNGQATFTNGYDFYQCGIEDVRLLLNKHYTLTKSAL